MTFFVYSPESQTAYFAPPRKPSVLLAKNLSGDILQHGLYEASLIEWSRQFCSQRGCTVDVGAHTGTYAVHLADVSQSVVAFEPQYQTYLGLCGSVALSQLTNVRCHNTALGSYDQVGETTLFIPSEDGGGSSVVSVQGQVIGEETVTVKTLDSYNLRDVCFIKIDVEGNEARVMEGARGTIERYRPTILFEDNSGYFDPTQYPVLYDLRYNVTQVFNYSNMFLASGQLDFGNP